MSLYAIGDFHLSFGCDKPMDIFGTKWNKHDEQIVRGFENLTDEDTCVICGDISWAMNMEQAKEDFLFIEKLPGKKIILKGNHDYWFTTASKTTRAFEEWGIKSIVILHNNCFFYDDKTAICGTRGWFYEIDSGSAHDKKILNREIMRLEASLKAAKDREKFVFLHYPPKYGRYECQEITNLLMEYNVKICCYGHLHGHGLSQKFEGKWKETEYLAVSGDLLGFSPKKIK